MFKAKFGPPLPTILDPHLPLMGMGVLLPLAPKILGRNAPLPEGTF